MVFPGPSCPRLLPRVCLAGRRPGAPAGGPPGGAVGRALPAHLRPPPPLTGHAEPNGSCRPGQGEQRQPLGGGWGGGQGPDPMAKGGTCSSCNSWHGLPSADVLGLPCSQQARTPVLSAPSHLATKAGAGGAVDPRLSPPPTPFGWDLYIIG